MIPSQWKAEYWKSIKSFDTEEKLDLYFYRPFGFLIAKAALQTPATPTFLTLVGLVLGMGSGYFFLHNDTTTNLVIASCMLVVAQVFDSADGQLARMGGKSTKFGLVLDGICDNFVFGSVYICSAITVSDRWGWWLVPLSLFAGACHSFQSSMLDFYNREYLFFGVGKKGDYWNQTLEEARKVRDESSGQEQLMGKLRFSWIWQQNRITTRSTKDRLQWKEWSQGPRAQEFQNAYCDHNRTILRFWRLMGPNAHTILILFFVFLRRFDLYLILADICFLSAALMALRAAQAKADQGFSQKLQSLGFKP